MKKLIATLLHIAAPRERAADESHNETNETGRAVSSSAKKTDSGVLTADRRVVATPRRASTTSMASRYGTRAVTHATIAGDSVLTSVGEYRKQRGELDSTPVKPVPVNPRGRN
jgi:hypothetical protein